MVAGIKIFKSPAVLNVDPVSLTFKIAYEVSDLVYYLASGSTPTGIQRVQQEISTELLNIPAAQHAALVIYDVSVQRWRTVPQDWLRFLVEAARSSRSMGDTWGDTYQSFASKIQTFSFHHFEQNEWLVNVGASWSLPSYFVHVRNLRRRGVRFAVFLHDCIPLRHPSYFEYEHTIEHTHWLAQIRETADMIFCNSEATRRDYMQMVRPSSPEAIHVNKLDASWVPSCLELEDDTAASDLLAENGIFDDNFVLCVGTIEPRKNHLTLIHVWDKLRHTHPLKSPKLVCVGRVGWKSEAAIAQAKALGLLKTKISFLGGVSDEILASLYRKCLLTIYLSYYEGWGLPISESLSAGKVCIAGSNSSLIEAGAGLAVHVDERSETSVYEAVTSFIDDPGALAEAEGRIAERYRPRTWRLIAENLVDTLSKYDVDRANPGLPYFEINRLYRFGRERPIQDFEQPWSAEPFCAGPAWYQAESWGIWTSKESAELGFRIAKNHQRPLLFLGLVAPPDGADFTVYLNGELAEAVKNVVGRKTIRVLLEDAIAKSPNANFAPIRLRIVSSRIKNMAEDLEAGDVRQLGTGFSYIIGFDQNSIIERIEFLEMMLT